MKEKLNVIRGKRILDQLNEAPYAELERNTLQFQPPTQKRQHAVNPVQVQQMALVPYAPSNALEVRANILSNGNQYQSIMFFEGVEYQEEDSPENVTFTGADNEEHHIVPIDLQRNNVKVRCTCLDFRWRFSVHNQEADALHGPGPDIYQKVPGSTRPPNNPGNVPGVCKHLMKLAIELRNNQIVR